MPIPKESTSKAAIRRMLAATNAHDEDRMYEAFDDIFSPDVVIHNQLPVRATGAEAMKSVFAMLHRSFPDLIVRIDDLLEEGDRVVGRHTVTGTNSGEFMGRPPTGRQVTYSEIFIFRFAHGRIAETWGVADGLSLMRQLGLVQVQ